MTAQDDERTRRPNQGPFSPLAQALLTVDAAYRQHGQDEAISEGEYIRREVDEVLSTVVLEEDGVRVSFPLCASWWLGDGSPDVHTNLGNGPDDGEESREPERTIAESLRTRVADHFAVLRLAPGSLGPSRYNPDWCLGLGLRHLRSLRWFLVSESRLLRHDNSSSPSNIVFLLGVQVEHRNGKQPDSPDEEDRFWAGGNFVGQRLAQEFFEPLAFRFRPRSDARVSTAAEPGADPQPALSTALDNLEADLRREFASDLDSKTRFRNEARWSGGDPVTDAVVECRRAFSLLFTRPNLEYREGWTGLQEGYRNVLTTAQEHALAQTASRPLELLTFLRALKEKQRAEYQAKLADIDSNADLAPSPRLPELAHSFLLYVLGVRRGPSSDLLERTLWDRREVAKQLNELGDVAQQDLARRILLWRYAYQDDAFDSLTQHATAEPTPTLRELMTGQLWSEGVFVIRTLLRRHAPEVISYSFVDHPASQYCDFEKLIPATEPGATELYSPAMMMLEMLLVDRIVVLPVFDRGVPLLLCTVDRDVVGESISAVYRVLTERSSAVLSAMAFDELQRASGDLANSVSEPAAFKERVKDGLSRLTWLYGPAERSCLEWEEVEVEGSDGGIDVNEEGVAFTTQLVTRGDVTRSYRLVSRRASSDAHSFTVCNSQHTSALHGVLSSFQATVNAVVAGKEVGQRLLRMQQAHTMGTELTFLGSLLANALATAPKGVFGDLRVSMLSGEVLKEVPIRSDGEQAALLEWLRAESTSRRFQLRVGEVRALDLLFRLTDITHAGQRERIARGLALLSDFDRRLDWVGHARTLARVQSFLDEAASLNKAVLRIGEDDVALTAASAGKDLSEALWNAVAFVLTVVLERAYPVTGTAGRQHYQDALKALFGSAAKERARQWREDFQPRDAGQAQEWLCGQDARAFCLRFVPDVVTVECSGVAVVGSPTAMLVLDAWLKEVILNAFKWTRRQRNAGAFVRCSGQVELGGVHLVIENSVDDSKKVVTDLPGHWGLKFVSYAGELLWSQADVSARPTVKGDRFQVLVRPKEHRGGTHESDPTLESPHSR